MWKKRRRNEEEEEEEEEEEKEYKEIEFDIYKKVLDENTKQQKRMKERE